MSGQSRRTNWVFVAILGILSGTAVQCGPLKGFGSLFGGSRSAWLPDNQWQQVVDQAASSQGFVGAVAVQRQGKILAIGGYGVANKATGEKNTPDTFFRLASVSKQFTAAAILQLSEKGLLGLGDPIEKFFPSWPAPSRKVTVHQLMAHTSGIPDYAHEGYDDTFPRSREQVLDLFYRKPLKFSPGSRYDYSNANYFILGYLIEKVSQLSYADYLKQNLFAVAKMPTAGFEWPKVLPTGFAQGYLNGKPATFVDSSFAFAAGALYGSARELALWSHALMTGKIINKASLQKMGTVHAGPYGGYGFWIDEQFGHTLWLHGGKINGFSAENRMLVDDDVSVIALSNHEGRLIGKDMNEAVLYGIMK